MTRLTLLDAAARSKPMASKPKKWMQKAVPESHKGKFTAKADRAGKSVHEYAEEEKHASGALGKEARLALTFEGEGRKRKRLRDVYKKKD